MRTARSDLRCASFYSRFPNIGVFAGIPSGLPSSVDVIPLPNGVGGGDTEAFAVSKKVFAIVADETAVYWSEEDGPDLGKVRWCPRSGCTGVPVTVANNGLSSSMLLESAAIYWGTDDGSIFKLAR